MALQNFNEGMLSCNNYNLKQVVLVKDTNLSGINRLDIKQLRIFQLLLQHRNVSKVAHLMGLTQQAISEQLKKLRNTFNDEMFIRTSNGVIPTQVAENMEHKLNQILSDIDNLIAPENFNPSSLTGTLKISTSDYALVTVFPRIIKIITNQAPQLKVVIRDFESDNLHQLMVTGELDLVITFPEFIPADYPNMLLFKEHHVCVAGANSAHKNKQYTLKEIASMPQVIVSPSRANLKGSHDAWFESKGLKRNVIMSVPSFSSAPDIIEAANAIGFLPSRLLPHPKVVALNITEQPPSFNVIAAWHARSENNPLHKWLLSLLKENFCQ